MKKAELKEFHKKLLALRARLTGEVVHLSDEAFHAHGDSTQPNHMAELGSNIHEQDVTIQMLQSEGNILSEIEAAIKRVENGTFGVCEMSGKPIPKARLNAIPWTRYRVECAKIAENRRLASDHARATGFAHGFLRRHFARFRCGFGVQEPGLLVG
ncbi:MAG: TraR/DksA C4-type zinc finger protein [Planctomycetota bacterium]